MTEPKAVFALIDCNNFFVSCERLFRPELEGQPVVVLSSNDGCVVARSNEAKLLGIPMAAPAFKWRDTFRQHSVTTFSANFEIYGDISKRITALLTTITPRIEVYSVDESFLDLSLLPITDYTAWGRAVRAAIFKNIGVPVSIGIAPSKTLAKLAAEAAKKPAQQPKTNLASSLFPLSTALPPIVPAAGQAEGRLRQEPSEGALDLLTMGQAELDDILNDTSIKEVWGVGWRLAPKLRAEGVSTALQLSRMRPQHAQQLMGVQGRKLVAELNGKNCYPLEKEQVSAQSILRSRTFGEDTNQAHVLESAIASMSARATYSLRREHLLARRIGFFANTNRHKPGHRQWSREIVLSQPTNDTGLVISLLTEQLGAIFNNQQQYHRLGVFLYDLIPEQALQTDLLGQVSVATHDRASARMQALDHINAQHGKGKIYYAAEDLSKSWQPKQQIRSPRYVSSWDELPKAHIV